jgi:hypothetical protein
MIFFQGMLTKKQPVHFYTQADIYSYIIPSGT